jgi:hypothetical protein
MNQKILIGIQNPKSKEKVVKMTSLKMKKTSNLMTKRKGRKRKSA